MILRVLCIGVLAAFIATPSWAEMAISESRCGGSEGPKPLEIFNGFSADVKPVLTQGSPKEFLLWEDAGRLVYRTQNGEIYSTKPDGSGQVYLGSSDQPLSPVVDKRERYLLTADAPWLLDTWQGANWLQFNSPFEYPNHAFWNRDLLGRDWLFSVKSFYDLNGSQRMQVSRYRAGDSQAEDLCPNLKYTPGNGYHIGEGHSYPFVYLYRVIEEDGGTVLHLYQLKVDGIGRCGIKDLGEYKRKIEGRVENVHWFEPLKHIAVTIVTPDENVIMWSTGTNNGCRRFSVGKDTRPIALNHRQPILALHRQDEPVELVYLSAEQALHAPVASGLPIHSLSDRDVALTSDGRTLFLTPTMPDQSRGLLRISLPAKQ